jgi:hypothetical protein
MIPRTWEIVDQFTANPQFVNIDDRGIKAIAREINTDLNACKGFFLGKPKWFEEIDWSSPRLDEFYEIVAYELILDSANYNYWYGRGDVRPCGASSYEMSKLLDEAFVYAHVLSSLDSINICCMAARRFKKNLTVNRYPNLENRIRHIGEVEKLFNREHSFIHMLIEHVIHEDEDADYTIECLTKSCPGYGGDIFLKRAFLFIIEMNRRMGWFKEDIHLVPIPADYQIPKMLHFYGALNYNDSLTKKILNNELIQSGSLEECEIRASAMKACQMIAEVTHKNMADIDTFLFANRKSCPDPIHLTITTDY